MVALPSLLFLAGIGTAQLGVLFSRLVPDWESATIIPILIWGVFLKPPIITRHSQLNQILTRQFEGSPEFQELMEFIATTTHGGKPILVNGVSDDFGIEALRWYVARNNKMLYSEVKVEAYPYREDKYKTARLRMRNVDRPWLDATFPKRPMASIRARSYYQYGVQIKNLLREQKFQAEAKDFTSAVLDLPAQTMEKAGRRVTIYKLY